jgi:endonuclease/exonuclease/phosphatase family metal-dependent hydrolase
MNIRPHKIQGVEFVAGAPQRRVVAAVRATLAHAVLLCGWAWAVFVLQPFGHRQWTLITILVLLFGLVTVTRRGRRLAAETPTRLERIFGRSLWLGRSVLAGALACWLGLIGLSAMSPGGALPLAKSNPVAIRVLTWNILHGTERGMPWTRYGWPIRKKAIEATLSAVKPDILCVQEALEEQVRFLAKILPGHRRVGVGRDDGRSAGEHCSILFDRTRFEELGSGTFWLEEPADIPPAAQLRLGPKRICTWVRLRDRKTGRAFRVYNTHQYLTERARREAVRIILARIDIGDPSDAILVAGDFNAPPDTRDRRLFEAAGIISSAQLAGVSPGSPTYHFYGIRVRRLDDILVNRSWRVVNQYVIDVKPENTFPSDHFGVMADLVISALEQRHRRELSSQDCVGGKMEPVGKECCVDAAEIGRPSQIAVVQIAQNGKLLRFRSSMAVRLSPFAPRKVSGNERSLSRSERRHYIRF